VVVHTRVASAPDKTNARSHINKSRLALAVAALPSLLAWAPASHHCQNSHRSRRPVARSERLSIARVPPGMSASCRQGICHLGRGIDRSATGRQPAMAGESEPPPPPPRAACRPIAGLRLPPSCHLRSLSIHYLRASRACCAFVWVLYVCAYSLLVCVFLATQ
jgi:hypothetical protein